MASSFQIPWAYRAATEPTSVSHDRETGPANDLTPTAGVRPGPPGAQEHSHGDGPLLKVVCVWYRSHNIIRHGPHTCRRTTRTALDEAIIPVVILSTVNNRDQVAHQDPPIKDRSPDIEVMTLVFCPTRHCLRWRLPMEFAWKSIWDTQKHWCGNLPTPTCDVTMHGMVVPYSSLCVNQSRPMKRLDTSVAKGKRQHIVTGVSGTPFQQCFHSAVIHVVPM